MLCVEIASPFFVNQSNTGHTHYGGEVCVYGHRYAGALHIGAQCTCAQVDSNVFIFNLVLVACAGTQNCTTLFQCLTLMMLPSSKSSCLHLYRSNSTRIHEISACLQIVPNVPCGTNDSSMGVAWDQLKALNIKV